MAQQDHRQKEPAIELEGEVIAALPDTFFHVKLDRGPTVLGKLSGTRSEERRVGKECRL